MNNNFIVQRAHATGANASQLISQNLTRNNTDLVNTLYLNILSRMPTIAEMTRSVGGIPASGAARTTAVQDLVWSLYLNILSRMPTIAEMTRSVGGIPASGAART